MAVAYKKICRKNPVDLKAPGKYYPHLVTQGNSADLSDVAYMMKENSSLSLGDIKSVLTNFMECVRTTLYNGQSVRIADFGVFSLVANTTGADTEKECGVKNIKSVRINFLASKSVKPNLTSTRAGDRLKFFDVATGVTEEKAEEGKPDNPQPDDNNPAA